MEKKRIKLIKVKLLKHIEGFSKKRVQWLKNKICEEGYWTRPVCIGKNHYLVMDGQHRLEVAKELNLEYIPCLLFDYYEVEVWSLRDNHKVTPQLVIERALKEELYPYKTVKHRFPKPIENCNYKLGFLNKGKYL